MNKRIDFTQAGGLQTYQDTLAWMQSSYEALLDSIAKSYGNLVILEGVVNDGTNVSSGTVVINGVIYPFVGSAVAPKVYINELTEDEDFADNEQKPIYSTKTARLSVVGDWDLSAFKRFKTDLTNLNDSDVLASAKSVKTLSDTILAILGAEPAIIIKGCEVSGVVGSALNIAVGTVMIDGKILSTPAFAGNFPVYLKNDGTYVNVAPGAGNYITFDPYTSQRYADVLRRAMTPTGEIRMFKTLSDRFDAGTGVGKWEMLGFKISDDLRDRVLVGYDRRAVSGGDPIWHSDYHIVGGTNGKNNLLLNANQIPPLTGRIHYERNGSDGTANSHHIYNGDSEGNGGGNDDAAVTIPNAAQQPVDMRQPFRVVVMAERI